MIVNIFFCVFVQALTVISWEWENISDESEEFIT